jgi:WhiB family redox-sensing transcriptional regulator
MNCERSNVAAYRDGCRCDGCKEAETARKRQWRANRFLIPTASDLSPHPIPALRVLPGGRDDSWRDLAACIDTDQRMFFPAQGDANRLARQMCASCPVRIPCLDYAVDNHEEFGIWGGTTPRERQAIRRRKRGAA